MQLLLVESELAFQEQEVLLLLRAGVEVREV
jgi:hypothetical protein